MQEYTIITVPADLLPQVVGELLQFAVNPDHVDVFHGVYGREIHAHPEVANAWYQARQQKPEPVPVQESAPGPEQGGATVTATAPVSDSDTKTSSVTVATGAAPMPLPKATTAATRATTASSPDKRTPSA